MNATAQLHDLGQSLWLDNITRDLLDERHARALHRRAVGHRAHLEPDDLRSRDQEQRRLRRGHSQQAARGQVGRGAVLRAGARGPHAGRRPVPAGPRRAPTASTAGCRSRCRRCWPTTRRRTHRGGARSCMRAPAGPTCSSRFRARREGLPAIEEAIFAGVPINVTLLFSREHYVAAAEAYLRGIERRIAAGLDPQVASVASVFVSRWDVAVAGKVPAALRRPARHRHRPAHLQGLPRPARLAALGAC